MKRLFKGSGFLEYPATNFISKQAGPKSMNPNVYEPLRKKYNLPSFEELDSEFEIGVIEHETWVLRNIGKNMFDKLEMTMDIIEKILQPDTNSYVDLYECKFFSGSEKDELFALLKHLMHAYRELLELEFINNEKAHADFIKHFFPEWLQVKKALLPFITKLKSVWKEDKRHKEKLEYLG